MNLYEVIASKTDESDGDSLNSTTSKYRELRIDEMFHGVRELRKWMKEDSELSEMDEKYPELLQSVYWKI